MSDTGGEPGRAAADPDPSQDERAELERLRAEVTELRGQQARQVRRRRIGWRTPVATPLTVVCGLPAPVSVLAVWSANQVSDISRYIANIEPLVHNPAIQNVLTDKITNQVTSRLNVTAVTDQAAALLTSKGPPRVGTLLVLGLIVAGGAFITGPWTTAVRTREAFASGLGWIRRSGEYAGLRTGPAGRWTCAHRTGLRISGVALAAVVFVFWGRPTALVVILLLVVLGLIELIGRPPGRPETAGQP